MESVTIKYQPNFKEKLMNFLNSFDSNKVKIISDRKEVFEKKTIKEFKNPIEN